MDTHDPRLSVMGQIYLYLQLHIQACLAQAPPFWKRAQLFSAVLIRHPMDEGDWLGNIKKELYFSLLSF
jgi:hypothetical protein